MARLGAHFQSLLACDHSDPLQFVVIQVALKFYGTEKIEFESVS